MSLIDSFYLIEHSKLRALCDQPASVRVKNGFFSKKTIYPYQDFLNANAVPLKGMEASGFNGNVFAYVIPYLQEKHNIDITTSAFDHEAQELSAKGGSVYILTHAQKLQYAHLLNPDNFSMEEIRQYNTEFEVPEEEAHETATAFIAAIRTLHNNLNEIRDNSRVVIFDLG